MIKLTDIILEDKRSKKVIVMAGGGGAGKTYVLSLLKDLGLQSLPIVNPDKYVEDPDHPMYNNLGAASKQAEKDALAMADANKTFVWDTTAANTKNIELLIDKGYDVYMIMVYTHPMQSIVSNFKRERSLPKASVFSTWRDVYNKIGIYQKMLGQDKFSLYLNIRPEFEKEAEAFNTAAKNGATGIKDYLENYSNKTGIQYKSSFSKPFNLSSDAEKAFDEEMQGIDYDKDNESLVKQIQKYWFKFYDKNGTGPGQDKMKKNIKNWYDNKDRNDTKYDDILSSIAAMLSEPKFLKQLQGSSIEVIDKKVQTFLT